LFSKKLIALEHKIIAAIIENIRGRRRSNWNFFERDERL